MPVFDNINTSYQASLAPTMAEAYIQRKALKNVEPNLGYMQDAQKVAMPKNSGKHVRFFRYTELPAITKPLYEGVTPGEQKLEETAFEVMTKNYGGFMTFTDEFDLWHVDKKTDAIAERLTRQARLSIDTVGRDQIMAGLNVMYPGNITARSSIGSTDKLTYDMIKRVVRNLKKKGAQPFPDGFFHAKIDQDTYYDLTNDTHWVAVANNYDEHKFERYLLGTIYNVKFYEVDNGKVFNAETYLFGTTTSMTVTAFNKDTRKATVDSTAKALLTEDIARELAGKLVTFGYTKSSSAKTVPMCIERVYPATGEITFRWVPDDMTSGVLSSMSITPTGGGNSTEVHATIIYGQDAFGMVGLGTTSEPNIQIIAKPAGSSGSLDPLNQRGSIAWKVPFFACAVLQDDFICRIEHAVSA